MFDMIFLSEMCMHIIHVNVKLYCVYTRCYFQYSECLSALYCMGYINRRAGIECEDLGVITL